MKVSNRRWGGLAAILGLFLFVGCSPDITETEFYSRHPEEEPAVETGPQLVGESIVGGVAISLFRTGLVQSGRNTLLVQVNNVSGGNAMPDIPIAVTASTQIDGVTYPAPSVSEPGNSDGDGFLEQSVLFLQAQGEEFPWFVHVTATVGSETLSATFEVDVADAIRVQKFASDAGDDLYVAWLEPVEPRTGDSPVEFAIYRDSGSSFQPVDGMSIDLYPYMDMGGGDGHSTPYTAPEAISNGRYRGRINFIMAGGWDLTVFVRLGDTPSNEIIYKGFVVK